MCSYGDPLTARPFPLRAEKGEPPTNHRLAQTEGMRKLSELTGDGIRMAEDVGAAVTVRDHANFPLQLALAADHRQTRNRGAARVQRLKHAPFHCALLSNDELYPPPSWLGSDLEETSQIRQLLDLRGHNGIFSRVIVARRSRSWSDGCGRCAGGSLPVSLSGLFRSDS